MKSQYVLTTKQQENLDKFAKQFEVKNIRTFRGMEGYGVNSTLYRNGKKLCNCDDSGQGGCMDFSDYNTQQKLDAELKKLIGIVKFSDGDKMTTDYDAEVFVNDLLALVDENKQLKKMCKNKTVVFTTDCKEGQYLQYRIPFDAVKSRPALEKALGDKLIEIINERFV